MLVFPVEFAMGGRGGIHVHEIQAILPHVSSCNETYIYATGIFPDGCVTVRGVASDLCALWMLYLGDIEEDEDEEEETP